ncbi:gamma-type small acid-soluble spore protein [Psychrobacillus sp. FSL H8-0483]|uniref:gamma-type small acid-soluble spore protein n=1 Tax=Psychrobacillus sp. FSL H8-0483 TaxID=2921389 RepID=UPI00315A0338
MKKNFGKGPNSTSKNAEFASETNLQEVREQNRQSQLGKSQKQSLNTEFASETDVTEVRQQNRQAEMKKQQQANGANSSSNQSK